jgi:uncharacterized protein
VDTYLASIGGGFSLGLLGSLHCLGMCGPLILALPGPKEKTFQNSILYSGGRIISYSVLGMLAGILTAPLRNFGLQQHLSIVAGILVILFAITNYFPRKYANGFLSKAEAYIKNKLSQQLGNIQASKGNYLVFGILNGLLPCGLVYVALTGSLAIADPLQSSIFTLGFGLGTSPAMTGVFIMKKRIDISLRNKIRKLVPISLFIMGSILILRGANLGIPGLSPKLNKEKQKIEACCKAKK